MDRGKAQRTFHQALLMELSPLPGECLFPRCHLRHLPGPGVRTFASKCTCALILLISYVCRLPSESSPLKSKLRPDPADPHWLFFWRTDGWMSARMEDRQANRICISGTCHIKGSQHPTRSLLGRFNGFGKPYVVCKGPYINDVSRLS